MAKLSLMVKLRTWAIASLHALKQMFDFRYCISFNILHPTVDPQDITNITGLAARIKRKAGEEIFNSRGHSLHRKADVSYWLTDMVPFVESSQVSISTSLLEAISKLQPYKQYLDSLKHSGGQFEFRIIWFSYGRNSTGEVESEVLSQCGSLGASLLFDFYDEQYTSDYDKVNSTEIKGDRHL